MNWSEAADALEAWLEHAAILIDGDELPDFTPPGPLSISGIPDRSTRRRVEGLLADVEEALSTLALRKAEIANELEQMSRLRKAGAGYLRNQ